MHFGTVDETGVAALVVRQNENGNGDEVTDHGSENRDKRRVKEPLLGPGAPCVHQKPRNGNRAPSNVDDDERGEPGRPVVPCYSRPR